MLLKHNSMPMKIDEYLENNRDNFFLLSGFILVLIAGFFSGYFYSEEYRANRELIVENQDKNCESLFNMHSTDSNGDLSSKDTEIFSNESVPQIADLNKKGLFVASKNSNIYHRPDCASARNIKEENKIWFSSEAEAQKRGFRPSKSCFR